MQQRHQAPGTLIASRSQMQSTTTTSVHASDYFSPRVSMQFRVSGCRQQSGVMNHDVQARYRLLATATLNLAQRYRLQSALQFKDALARYRLQSGTAYHDLVARYRLVKSLDALLRFSLVKTGDLQA